MNPFTNSYTIATGTNTPNDPSVYPQGEFINPALLQLNRVKVTNPPAGQSQPPGVGPLRCHTESFQPLDLPGCGDQTIGSHGTHPLGNSVNGAAPQLEATTIYRARPSMIAARSSPLYDIGEQYHHSHMNEWTHPAHLSRGYNEYPPQQPSTQYQLPTPASTPNGYQSTHYVPHTPTPDYHINQHRPSAARRQFPAAECPPVHRGDQDPSPSPPGSSRLIRPNHISTGAPVRRVPSGHIANSVRPIAMSNSPKPRGETGYGLPTPSRRAMSNSAMPTSQVALSSSTLQSQVASRSPTAQSRNNDIGDVHAGVKDYTTPPLTALVHCKNTSRTTEQKVDSDNAESIVPDEIEAPPSPKLTVKWVEAGVKRGRRRRNKKEGKRKQIEGEESLAPRDQAYDGLGWKVEKRIEATGPATGDTLSEYEPIVPEGSDRWRCRWDGCRQKVVATQQFLREHLRTVHNVNAKNDVKCLWRPALRVRFHLQNGELSEPYYVTSHNLAYTCTVPLGPASVTNHIGTHLYHEQQPNPTATYCEVCRKSKMARGGHSCGGKLEAKRKREPNDVEPESKRRKGPSGDSS